MKIIQVGYGYWGKSWLQFIADDPNCELAALVVRTPETLKRAQEEWGLPDNRCFNDYDAALELEADVVIIVMPHHTHIEFAKKAVIAGKDVLIEKPLCDDIEEAKEFARWMDGRSERVFVSQNYRYRDEMWQLRHGLTHGDLGSLQFIELDYRAGMTTDPQEHIWNTQGWRGKQVCMQAYEVSIHHFDMLRFLVGSNVKRLYANTWNPEWAITRGPESFFINLEFENGVHALFSTHMSSVGAPTEFQGNWLVQGSRGLVTWHSGQKLKLFPADDNPGRIPTIDETECPGFDRAGILVELQRARLNITSTLPTLEDNLYSLAIASAALISGKEHRVVEMSEIIAPVGGRAE